MGEPSELIAALHDPAAYPHPVERIEVVETHISWVVLTGRLAYKIHKPLNLGFADFSTLALRKYDCEEELRLNRRLAPALYLGVVPIGPLDQRPCVGSGEPVCEYAVQMQQLPAEARLDRVLARGQLRPEHIDQLAADVARFHAAAAVAGPDDPYGGERVWQPVADTFAKLQELATEPDCRRQIAALDAWSQAQWAALRETFLDRKRQGRVRECHGDLHLENLLLVEGRVVPFDCLEFNPQLRWIDVLSDLAFAVMDLVHRGRADFARRLLDRYLAASGDYAGLRVLAFYEVYRALVRAKVAAIRAGQESATPPEIERLRRAERFRGAGRVVHPAAGAVAVDHARSEWLGQVDPGRRTRRAIAGRASAFRCRAEAAVRPYAARAGRR